MSYPILAQRDPRWKDKSIGYSSVTVGSSGCLFVSLLMMVCRDQTFLPVYIDSFMGCLKGHSNYTQGGEAYLQSFNVSTCRPTEWGPCVVQNSGAKSYIGEDMPSSELSTLIAWLKSGQSALIEVDDRGAAATNVKVTHRDHQHFVLGIGVNAAGAIVVHDPWYGDESTLTPRYGPTNEFAIYRAILYKTSTNTPTPVTTASPLIIGAHTLHDGADNYLSKLGTTKGRITAMSADVLRDAIRVGHEGAQRTWHTNDDLTPQQIVDLQQYIPDDVKPKVILVTGNEGDWGYGRRGGESIASWMQRITKKTRGVAAIAYQRGYRKFTFGNAAMGCYDWTDETMRVEFGNAFRGMYNNQTLDGTKNGTPCEWWYDGHCYVPDATWLYDSRVVPSLLSNLEFGVQPSILWGQTSVTRRVVNPRNGQEMTWMEPAPETHPTALPSTSRVIHPWDWFLTRSNFLFWEEMGIGFDPLIRRVVATEGLFDEGGIGGASAHHYTPKQVHASILRMLDILEMPIVVNGKSYPQPHRGFTCFTSARNDPQWSGGYGIDYVLQSNEVDVTKWRRD